jgi:hypothetical protein
LLITLSLKYVTWSPGAGCSETLKFLLHDATICETLHRLTPFHVTNLSQFPLHARQVSRKVEKIQLFATIASGTGGHRAEQVGNLSEHARRKSIWRHILGVNREFIWF